MKNRYPVHLILPTQLFDNLSSIVPIAKDTDIFILEHPHYFTAYAYHKKKLFFHLVTMDAYTQELKKTYTHVGYIRYKDYTDFMSALNKTGRPVSLIDPIDIPVYTDITQRLKQCTLTVHESPSFLNSSAINRSYFSAKKKFLFHTFYQYQRKRLNILIDAHNKPIGNRWSFDVENRDPYDGKTPITSLGTKKLELCTEQYDIVESQFSTNPGVIDPFWLPTTHAQARAWLKEFFTTKLRYFGKFQDAIVHEQPLLFHSALSPLLNIGLLTPAEVVNCTIAYAQKHAVPLASLESFIRQVIGWREYVRGIYQVHGHHQMKANFFGHTDRLPNTFWTANTGIYLIDETIKTVLTHAYTHHIERLMILGNSMLLLEYDPSDVFTWFMELFIDAYEWVMVPNVYGMSQFADGGLMTTKPYISGSHYLLSMSNYKKDNWCAQWDILYKAFLIKHEATLARIPRMSLMYTHINKLSKAVKGTISTESRTIKQAIKKA